MLIFLRNSFMEKFPSVEDKKYLRIYGGIAMPVKSAGYICVLGITRDYGANGLRTLVLLDEGEREDPKELIQLAGGLDFRYRPERWYGDEKDPLSRKFIRELNTSPEDRGLTLTRSLILNNPKPLQYMFPTLKDALFEYNFRPPDNSIAGSYLQKINAADIFGMDLGDAPIVEALSYAGLEIIIDRDKTKKHMKVNNEYYRV